VGRIIFDLDKRPVQKSDTLAAEPAPDESHGLVQCVLRLLEDHGCLARD
jgi:hypothetical protein